MFDSGDDLRVVERGDHRDAADRVADDGGGSGARLLAAVRDDDHTPDGGHEAVYTCDPERTALMSRPEIVLRAGRVIDPESGFDAVADVAVGRGRVLQIGTDLPAAPTEVDVAGLVVTAGFVDLHSHVNDLAGLRLQALDGVTTALELEAGAAPVAAA